LLKNSLSHILCLLWHQLSGRRRRQFGWLLLLMMLTSLAEIISIGAVFPFLGALTNPQIIFDLPLAQPLFQLLRVNAPSELLIIITIGFAFAALIAGGLRLLLLSEVVRLSYQVGGDLSTKIFRLTLYQTYAVHISRNSSEIIDAISRQTGAVINTITSMLTLLGSSVILLAILVTLLLIDPLAAVLAFGGFGMIYIAIVLLTRRHQDQYSQIVADDSAKVIKLLQEGLGGIRDILIDGNQETYIEIYRKTDARLRLAQGANQFIGQSPRYAMEALGMVVIAVLAFSLAERDGVSRAIPILGSLALGAQRLLPLLQQAYQGWSVIQGSKATLLNALKLLNQPLPAFAGDIIQKMPFERTINLNNIWFRHDENGEWTLKNINLTIAKGTRLGIMGTTGSGKSTLLDILMGLLKVTEGALTIDDELIIFEDCQGWQKNIAHVPQMIFLADGTIQENIAFGIPKDQINFEKVRRVAQIAQIENTIENLELKYQTVVGESGLRLSGGQRQRIGIARALYKDAEVIIFDEATSALDADTERAVMRAIEDLGSNLTIIIVAHRISTLKNCNKIIELSNGGIIRTYGYGEL
jgi:ABC-type multidrug transport system fused ATPase/permease subunit